MKKELLLALGLSISNLVVGSEYPTYVQILKDQSQSYERTNIHGFDISFHADVVNSDGVTFVTFSNNKKDQVFEFVNHNTHDKDNKFDYFKSEHGIRFVNSAGTIMHFPNKGYNNDDIDNSFAKARKLFHYFRVGWPEVKGVSYVSR